MPFSSGTYSLPSGNPVVTGTTISSTTTNTTNSDIATALSSCILKDGTQTVTANIPMASHKLTGLSAGTTAGDSVEYAGSPSFTNLAYTGTLTGSTGVLNIGSGQVYKDASGNVGIGTSSPSSKLHVLSSGLTYDTGTAQLVTRNDGPYISIGHSNWAGTSYAAIGGTVTDGAAYTLGAMRFFTRAASADANLTERMRIDSSGNVGIGVTSPAARLHVKGTTTNSGILVSNITSGLNIGVISNYASWQGSGTSDDFVVAGFGARNLIFGTNGAPQMTIDSSGNVLIGSTTSTGKLRIKQSADAYSGAIILENFGNTNYWGFQVGSDNNLYYGYNNTSRGVFNNATGAYTTISDANLKENVINYTNALDKVNLLRPVTYNFIDDKNKYNQIGLIAQEVLNVIPEIVAKPANEDGYYGLNYAGLTPILIKAIQEQQTLIEELTARLTALEAK
jgi:hypothetical protein